MDSSTTWVDDFCCPLYIKAKIFSFWTLTHGIGIAVISSYSLLHSSFRDDEKVLLIYHLATLFALIHIVAGIFMHIGIFQNAPRMYLTGIILSWMLPMFCLPFIYLPVMQIFFTITSYRFFLLELNK